MDDLKEMFERQKDPKYQEFLKEAVARGIPFTDDPTADLMAYAAKKEERQKAEQAAAGESELSDHRDIDPSPSETSTLPKELLDKCIALARKIAGAE